MQRGVLKLNFSRDHCLAVPGEEKKDNRFDCPFGAITFRGPYRGRTGDLHNAIVALSQAELTALANIKIAIRCPKVKRKLVVSADSFAYISTFPNPMRPIAISFSAFLLVLSFTTGCKDTLPSQEDSSSIVLPDSNLSYSKDIEPLWLARCVSCHSGSTAPDLTPPSYSNLINYQPSLVVGGDGSNSLLLQILDGRVQPSMPPTGSRLTQNQLNGIKRWIDEGAINN